VPSVTRWGKTPEVEAAHVAVARAIKRGEIIVPAACTDCGEACRPVLHHDSYDRPLDVRALCRSCHIRFHSRLSGRPFTEALA
jgi:ferredoxin